MEERLYRVGRIPLKCEKILETDLGSNPIIYLKDEDIERLKETTDHLRLLKMMHEIIHHPDFGMKNNEALYLLRAYEGGEVPRFYQVEIVKKEEVYRLRRFCLYKADHLSFKQFKRIA